jgi:hypothetical protein
MSWKSKLQKLMMNQVLRLLKIGTLCGLILLEELEIKFNVKFTLNELLNIKKIKNIKNILSVRSTSICE